MNSFEAILCLAAYISIISVFAFVLNSSFGSADSSLKDFESRGNALYCVSLIDSFFSNSASLIENSFPCSTVDSNAFSDSQSLPLLSDSDFSFSSSYFIEVKDFEHYK